MDAEALDDSIERTPNGPHGGRTDAFAWAVLHAVRDPLWATDPELRVEYWNDAATATFGWTAEEVIGRPTQDIFQTTFPGSTREEIDAREPVWIEADEARLAQAVGNLLVNAIKFTPQGGLVSLSLVTERDTVAVVRVVDTGVGIAPEQLGRLFEPFVQVEDALGRSQAGLGLGLSVVKGVASCTVAPWKRTATAPARARRSPCACRSHPIRPPGRVTSRHDPKDRFTSRPRVRRARGALFRRLWQLVVGRWQRIRRRRGQRGRLPRTVLPGRRTVLLAARHRVA